ncbi:carbonic anhydrase [Coniella lustricola]|uniref:Carbonic anhydrase n=1 Tax=Coniella lustricola TaxID=2025994 RepID=A0A2T2ZSA3_9PEZI|nr:carbonic anhydrase [Coniella lustricola]
MSSSGTTTTEYTGQLPEWLADNTTFAATTFPTLPQPWHMVDQREPIQQSGKMTVVLTCLDPRCVPETFFGPSFNGAVIRNAGGRATDDAVRSLSVLRALAGLTTVAVVHHADCGVTHVTTQEITDATAPNTAPPATTNPYSLFTTEDYDSGRSVRHDVHTLQTAPALAGLHVYGFKLDTFTGKLEAVEV